MIRQGSARLPRARLLRQVLTTMATAGATLVDLTCDGWTSPTGHHYDRKPKRTPPPKIGDDARLPPLGDDPGG